MTKRMRNGMVELRSVAAKQDGNELRRQEDDWETEPMDIIRRRGRMEMEIRVE